MKKSLKYFYIFTPIVLGAGIGLITKNGMDYNIITKPPLSPPSFLFPTVWSILYLNMGISYYILKNNNEVDENLDKLYYGQLVVNLIWPILFFTFKLRLLSSIWIILLDILVTIMVYKFYKKNKAIGYLNIPYLIWVLFATYLNIAIYVLN